MESNNNMNTEIAEMYLSTLSVKERRAYEIARSHLGSSFSLFKSVGFIKWWTEYCTTEPDPPAIKSR